MPWLLAGILTLAVEFCAHTSARHNIGINIPDNHIRVQTRTELKQISTYFKNKQITRLIVADKRPLKISGISVLI